ARGPHADVPFGSTGAFETPPERGHPIVQAPRDALNQVAAYDQEAVGWDPSLPVNAFGFLDLRWGKKAIVANFAGNIELVGLKPGSREGLRDMRRWSNWAMRVDWSPPDPPTTWPH